MSITDTLQTNLMFHLKVCIKKVNQIIKENNIEQNRALNVTDNDS